tara:strand:- start:79 stop:708 length:630 start_codon:yes stop_codon:yes gene_type:complete
MSVFYRFQDSGLDDWDKSNNYVQMGFRPGFAIQARELTQMQTILQSQITALSRRFFKSGSIMDGNLSFTSGAGGSWSATLGSGYVYIEPTNKDLGYYVYIPDNILWTNIPTAAGQRTFVYIRWEEVQANPDGNEFPAQGGYAKVIVDGSLKDNAQGYANHSAPGASRYQINITGQGSYISGQGELPVNSAIVAYIEDDVPRYWDTGSPV